MRPKMIWVVMGLGIFVNLLVLPTAIFGRAVTGSSPSSRMRYLMEDDVVTVDVKKAIEKGICAENDRVHWDLTEYLFQNERSSLNYATLVGMVSNLVLLAWMGLIASANTKPAADASSKP